MLAFGHYRVLNRDGTEYPHELGRGAMGVTYKAVDTSLGNFVALKVINSLLLGSASTRARFLREAKAAAQLSHANIARVFHLGQEGEDCFYAMEFIEGETLEDFVRREGPLDPASALRLAAQIARGLQAAHARGLLHRDLKPANVMLVREDDEYSVKIIDFGLVKRLDTANGGSVTDGAGGGTGDETLALSQEGFCGTPQYGSPEQFDTDRAIDARADLYSLGATLWFLLEGRPPFAGNLPQIVMQVLQAPLPFERLVAARHTPAAVVDLLKRLLAREAGGRPADASAARKEILAVLENVPLAEGSGAAAGGGKGVAVPVSLTQGTSAADTAATLAGEAAAEFNTEEHRGKAHRGTQSQSGEGDGKDNNPSALPPPSPPLCTSVCLSSVSSVLTSPPAQPKKRYIRWLIVALALPVAGWGMIYGFLVGDRYSRRVYSEQRMAAARIELARGNDDAAAYQFRRVAIGDPDWNAARGNLKKLGEKWRLAADALRDSDGAKAVALYEKAADVNDARAQFHLGAMYQDGSGGQKRDLVRAATLYTQAADQGLPDAQFNLGHMYEIGEGVATDLKQAAALYEKSAAGGDGDAQNNLGHLYQLGLGVPRDPVKAFAYYRRAADAGNATAQSNLATMYLMGETLPKPDRVQAVVWFEKAAAQGSAEARNNLGTLYEQGSATPDGKPDYTRAAGYYRQAAEAGSSLAQMNMGSLYLRGAGVPADGSQAASWFRLAAQQGEIGAMYNLGLIYSQGVGVGKDLPAAAAWYRKAAEAGLAQQGSERYMGLADVQDLRGAKDKDKDKAASDRKDKDKDKDKNKPAVKVTVATPATLDGGTASGQNLLIAAAQHNLGLMLLRGEGVPADPKQGIIWLRRSADLGFAAAQSNLGMLYLEGRYGTPKDPREAVAWLRRASDNGDMQSRAMLGRALLHGTGVETADAAQGMALLQDAVKAGNPVAQAYLGDCYRDGTDGMPVDLARAQALYRQGAAQGDDDGQYRLGDLYEKGLGVPKNKAEALKWYTLAAAHDNAEAKAGLERVR